MISDRIRKKGYRYVIVPGYFSANGWTQKHYYDLWEKVILDFTHILYFHTGWEYSTGCITELYIGLKSGKDLRNAAMKPLNITGALKRIRTTAQNLEQRGFNPVGHYDILRKIELLLSQRPIFT